MGSPIATGQGPRRSPARITVMWRERRSSWMRVSGNKATCWPVMGRTASAPEGGDPAKGDAVTEAPAASPSPRAAPQSATEEVDMRPTRPAGLNLCIKCRNGSAGNRKTISSLPIGFKRTEQTTEPESVRPVAYAPSTKRDGEVGFCGQHGQLATPTGPQSQTMGQLVPGRFTGDTYPAPLSWKGKEAKGDSAACQSTGLWCGGTLRS